MTGYEDLELRKFILILILGKNKTKIFNTCLLLSNIPKKKGGGQKSKEKENSLKMRLNMSKVTTSSLLQSNVSGDVSYELLVP